MTIRGWPYRRHGHLRWRALGGAVIAGLHRCGTCGRDMHTRYGFRMHLRVAHITKNY